MSHLKLTIATTDYEHFRDFRLGTVKAEGIDHNWLNLSHHECFARFTANREFDVSELSFAKFSAQISRADTDIVGLPVICSRLFRFSSFYVNKKSKITKVWPIMHIIAMKKAIIDEHPWAARNLYNAFLESKRRSVERILDPAVSRYPVPWLATYARRMRDRFGGDLYPYGIEENRPTWEQMMLYTFQQGIARRLMTPEEIFPAGIMTKVVI
jgi:hypothetical protein